MASNLVSADVFLLRKELANAKKANSAAAVAISSEAFARYKGDVDSKSVTDNKFSSVTSVLPASIHDVALIYEVWTGLKRAVYKAKFTVYKLF
jgi:hypothetical protein